MSEMVIYEDLDQNSPEWFAARLGVPTASMFSAILAKGEGKTRKSYMHRLASEIITGELTEGFTSAAMERGHEMEPEARNYYSFLHDIEPQRVGFIRNGDKGCSPDSLIGEKGMLEIKTKRADLLIDVLDKGEFPSEHKAQCQGALWVAEREWIDICVYWPKMPVFIKRAYRDDAYILTLSAAVRAFNEELQETVARVRSYGQKVAA
jgi:YqaJ-like viral recombinase domain